MSNKNRNSTASVRSILKVMNTSCRRNSQILWSENILWKKDIYNPKVITDCLDIYIFHNDNNFFRIVASGSPEIEEELGIGWAIDTYRHVYSVQGDLKLTLPEPEEKSSYEPSSTFHNTKTSMRLLKGKIDRGQSNDKVAGENLKYSDMKSSSTLDNFNSTQKLSLNGTQDNFKLVLNDSPQIVEKKVAPEPVTKPLQKRIMIMK